MSKDWTPEEVDRYFEYIKSLCQSVCEGCACSKTPGHEGLHTCRAESCDYTWTDKDEARFMAEISWFESHPRSMMEILQYGHPVLHQVADPVISLEQVRHHIEPMFETMYAAFGIGLAAPQVGIPLQFFVYHVGDEKGIMVNPVIVTRSEDHVFHQEACLSCPSEVIVKRSPKVRVAYADLETKLGVKECTGLMSYMVQHEVDHLNGILILDQLMK